MENPAFQLRSAAVHGALAGLIYGLFEYAFVIVRPMIQWRPTALGPSHWTWEAAFLAVYVVLGAAIGSLAAMLSTLDARREASRLVTAAAVLGLVAIRIFTENPTLPNLAFDLSLAVFALAVAGSRFLPGRQTWTSWICSPWVAFPLVLLLIKTKDTSRGVLPFLALWAGTGLAILIASRIGILRRTLENRYFPFSLAGCTILLAALVSTSVLLGRPLPIPQAKSASASARPNVLLIVLDTVRADHLSVYGYPRKTTPNLAALASEGVLFRNAISTADITVASHASMFTGLYTSWHRAHPEPPHDPGHLDPSFHTLAEILGENGYTTLAELANCAYLRPEFGLTQGFGFYDVRAVVRKNGADGEYYLRPFVRRVLDLFASTSEIDRVYRRGDQITGEGLRLLDAMRGRTAPFFLVLNYMDAHDPYVPPTPYRDLFPGRIPSFRNARVFELREELPGRRTPAHEPELAHIVSQYDAGIAFMDSQVKRLFDGMKESGLYDNTLVIVTSDHGEGLGERGVEGHPASVHQELVHVPLWIKFPRSGGAEAGRTINVPVSGVDLLPTILDTAGIPVPAGLPGQSLRTLPTDTNRQIVSESFVHDHLNQVRGRSDRGQRAFYEGSWKLIADTNGKIELYDWKNDPTESTDIHYANAEVTRRLNEALNNWLLLVPHPKSPVRKTDRQTLERLRGLGYVQ